MDVPAEEAALLKQGADKDEAKGPAEGNGQNALLAWCQEQVGGMFAVLDSIFVTLDTCRCN